MSWELGQAFLWMTLTFLFYMRSERRQRRIDQLQGRLEQLLTWQEAQRRAPELGPHRTQLLAFDAPLARDGDDPSVTVNLGDERYLVVKHMRSGAVFIRKAAPPPTTVPSGGREIEE